MAKKIVDNDEFFPEEFMTDEEIDEMYRPQKCNTRKAKITTNISFFILPVAVKTVIIHP